MFSLCNAQSQRFGPVCKMTAQSMSLLGCFRKAILKFTLIFNFLFFVFGLLTFNFKGNQVYSNIKPQISILVHKEESELYHRSLLNYINKKAQQFLPHLITLALKINKLRKLSVFQTEREI